MSIFNDLLGRGYFPIQLPPPFTSATFASQQPKFEKAWTASKVPTT
jgi:hypothetical protein